MIIMHLLPLSCHLATEQKGNETPASETRAGLLVNGWEGKGRPSPSGTFAFAAGKAACVLFLQEIL